jgi:hypothetical protein
MQDGVLMKNLHPIVLVRALNVDCGVWWGQVIQAKPDGVLSGDATYRGHMMRPCTTAGEHNRFGGSVGDPFPGVSAAWCTDSKDN